jgi:hypothetical protein
MGAYAAVLRHTPVHDDLVKTTDNEVLCRLVGRWVGQGGKASLANTADADILDLAETGRAMEKEGNNYRWKERTTSLRLILTWQNITRIRNHAKGTGNRRLFQDGRTVRTHSRTRMLKCTRAG